MIGGGQVLALVTARAGSKRLSGKNLRKLGGRPLIAWSIDAARGAQHVDRVVVSTEDEAIAAVARQCGAEVPFMRPAALAADDSSGMDPVFHALQALPGYDWVVLLQPTSPLRQAADIDACLELCEKSAAPACVSVVAPDQSPYLGFQVNSRGRIESLLGWDYVNSRRQDLPPTVVLNGAIYVAHTEWLERQRSFVSPETLAYEMPRERSVDIDSAEDFARASALLEAWQTARPAHAG